LRQQPFHTRAPATVEARGLSVILGQSAALLTIVAPKAGQSQKILCVIPCASGKVRTRQDVSDLSIAVCTRGPFTEKRSLGRVATVAAAGRLCGYRTRQASDVLVVSLSVVLPSYIYLGPEATGRTFRRRQRQIPLLLLEVDMIQIGALLQYPQQANIVRDCCQPVSQAPCDPELQSRKRSGRIE